MATSTRKFANQDSPGFNPPSIKSRAATPLASIRDLLTPALVIEGEKPEQYERHLALLGDAIGARDLLDWVLINDIVSLNWEMHRARRMSHSLILLRRRSSVEIILRALLPVPEFPPLIGSPATDLAIRWSDGDETAVKKVEALFKKAKFSMAEVDAQTLNHYAADFERIDARVQRCEERRDQLLQQIDRRRANAARTALKSTEAVIDAEFESVPPPGLKVSAG